LEELIEALGAEPVADFRLAPGHGSNFDKDMYAAGFDLFLAPLDRLTFNLAYNYQHMKDEAFLSSVAYGG